MLSVVIGLGCEKVTNINNDILQRCSLSQCVSGPTHILGHTLDILISPCDSDFVRNVNVGDFISDHAAIRSQLDFSHPTTCIDKMVSYRRYHRIDIDQFCNDLSNIPFVLSPGGTAAELYDQYMVGVTQVLYKHAPIISRRTKRQSDEWLSDSYHMARSLRRQFERKWRKHETQLNRSRLLKQTGWCNRLANKDKGSYYTNLITANSDDPKKLWQSLRKVLHRTSETVLPAHSSEKASRTHLLLSSPIKYTKSGTCFLLLVRSMMHLIWCPCFQYL